MRKPQDPLKRAFWKQKWHAKRRDIVFSLTFDEWLAIWTASGHLYDRGRRKDQYVMARIADRGAYAVGNVVIITASENCIEQYPPWFGRKHTEASKLKMSRAMMGNKNGLKRMPV